MTTHYIATLGFKGCREILSGAPDETATHILNGNYGRLEENNKIRTFHKCGGCCYAYGGNHGCGENMQWSRYTNGWIDEKYISLIDIRTELALHEKAFEAFLAVNDMLVRKFDDGYLFSNRLIYDAWIKSPELGLKTIQEMSDSVFWICGTILLLAMMFEEPISKFIGG